ncbi:hypothetical protein [Streptomyces rubellomurinus]|uniref:Integral membrane protein n=1 Tax=Streptomyces rubellomurinus (strain ATCC 31215) TaxID=359131 RepID=A0A0F2TFN3_STRR3|nr:hypothetical protein [Streptomyces rubellomurinus]KJS61959.1 hypothetical protein VM95_11415 [Streptomyces rubellomurinus]
MLWGAAGILAAVVGLTGYAAVQQGADDDASHPGTSASPPPSATAATTTAAPVPVSTYSAPPSWEEPDRWLAAPRGTRTVGGREVGFPHTMEGAVGMLVASSAVDIEGATTTVDEHLASYTTYTAVGDQTPAREQRVRQGAAKADARARATMGAPDSGPLPAGAWMRSHLVGFKIVQARPDAVTAHLLLRNGQKAGETARESVFYTVGIVGVVWRDDDWKFDTAGGASPPAGSVPEIAAPGDAAFNTQGWTAIRQAS